MSGSKQTTNEWSQCLMRVGSARDKAAFAKLFAHFAPRVKSYLMRSGASSHAAEEATQEAMVIVWQKAAMFNPQMGSASTWIFTVARNKQLDEIRRIKRPEPEELPWGLEPVDDAGKLIAVAQENELLRAAVNKLPQKQKEMIEKAFFGDLTHSEISGDTGLPLGTIKSRIRLALERLRHDMTKTQ